MKIKTNKPLDISALSGLTVNLRSDVETYTFTGTKTLGSNFSITTSGTPVDGAMIWFWFQTAITPSTYTFNVLGTVIPSSVVSKHFLCIAEYFGGVWNVLYGGNQQSGKSGGGIGVDPVTGELYVAAGGMLDSMVNNAAAIAFSKMEALTADRILGSPGGVVTPLDPETYPSLAELALLKGITGSSIQSQISAIIASLDDYALTSAVTSAIASALTAYYTKTQVDSTLSNYVLTSALSAYYTSSKVDSIVAGINKGTMTAGTPIITNTTFTAASLTQLVIADTSAGGFTATLPLISTLVDGQIVQVKQWGANRLVVACNAGDSGFITSLGGSAPSLLLTTAGGITTLRCDKTAKTWTVIN